MRSYRLEQLLETRMGRYSREVVAGKFITAGAMLSQPLGALLTVLGQRNSEDELAILPMSSVYTNVGHRST